ncbi:MULTISPECIES: DUF2878 domain-containing protein [Marinomonas]|uniref:DUF2878 domain-containing protein n=1 Tax=Marinomonas arctica TaxID=383750 RepID=A0A7H1J5G9_9GAMM|nr:MULTISPECIES: DUF2878 domain-containing protein [Marinomonas]MCS7488124.1 hypothetical protein [Marinomonas sp. BSi20414]QNT05735.1 DUF2878 domain-containing protein [Marinomonas arctica]GGN36482.1 membrane protein [Marinomonas arctica]
MKSLLNAILFQAVWFICLLAGDLWALVVTASYLFLHDRYFMRTRREWRLFLAFLTLGVIVDGTLFHVGVFSFSADNLDTISLPPVWLLCLWVSVATLFAHSLSFLRSRYLLGALMGAIGPTLSYFAGAKLSGISLAEPIGQTLLIVAIIWSLVIPLGIWLSEKWALFDA